jgi:hypothetical protein
MADPFRNFKNLRGLRVVAGFVWPRLGEEWTREAEVEAKDIEVRLACDPEAIAAFVGRRPPAP